MSQLESVPPPLPPFTPAAPPPGLDEALSALSVCAHACRSLVDGLSPASPDHQVDRCIELGAAGAAACITTHSMLLEGPGPRVQLTRAQLQACVAACTACALECESHGLHHEVCRACADACRACVAACSTLDVTLGTLPELPDVPDLPELPVPPGDLREEAMSALSACAQACQRVNEACTPVASGSLTGDAARLSGECAAACAAAHTMFGRPDAPGVNAQRAQLQSCIVACAACAAACEIHSSDHEPCRACAAACRRCETACRALDGGSWGALDSVPAQVA